MSTSVPASSAASTIPKPKPKGKAKAKAKCPVFAATKWRTNTIKMFTAIKNDLKTCRSLSDDVIAEAG